jgi:glutaconate CoA-transferase subunit B
VRGHTRAELGMPGAGPVRVITDKGVLEVDDDSGELVLAALYPGMTADEVQADIGWPLGSRDTLLDVDPPEAEELRLLREVLDPNGLYLRS